MKNKKVSKRILKYTAIFEPANEGGFVVSVPALPGCVTQGDSFEESVDMVKDAICGYLAILKDTKQVIPVPIHVKDIKTGLMKSIIKQAESIEKEFLQLK